eukprot:scaffold248697_cov27-Tisochrysis_lutea.AAC.2
MASASAPEPSGSVSTTTTEILSAAVRSAPTGDAPTRLTLKLRKGRRRVRFAEEVVDNEELNRKKSKCCCQYHRPRAFDESSDEEEDAFGILRQHPFLSAGEPSGDAQCQRPDEADACS